MLTAVVAASFLCAAISGVLYGCAAVIKAKAWRTWAERCHPKGTFHTTMLQKNDDPQDR